MSKSIISQARLIELLSYSPDTGAFTRNTDNGTSAKAGDVAGTVTPAGYIRISVDGNKYQAHRLAWLYAHGEWPADQIDHIDGNRANNKITNLREVTRAENKQNIRGAHCDSESGVLGVNFEPARGKWRAQLRHAGKVYMRRCNSVAEAQEAYLALKRIHHPFCTV